MDWRKSLCFLTFSKIMTIFADDLESPDCSKALRSRIAIPDASRFRSKTWSFVLSMIASLLFVSKKVASSYFVLRDSSYICSALENPVHSVFSHTDKVCFPHRQKRDQIRTDRALLTTIRSYAPLSFSSSRCLSLLVEAHSNSVKYSPESSGSWR